MNYPFGIGYVNGHLWVTNVNNNNLQEWVTNGASPVTTITTFNGAATFYTPTGIGLDPVAGNVYVTDEINGQVEVFGPTGTYLTTFGNTQLNLAGPNCVAVNSAGTTVYVMAFGTNKAYTYSITAGTPPLYAYQSGFTFGASGSAPATLHWPYDLKIDGGGDFWVADFYNHRVAEYNAAGVYAQAFTLPAPSPNPAGLYVDGSGNVYVASNNGYVVEFNPSGTVIGEFGRGILSSPGGITSDGAGNFYVTDVNNNQIVAFH